MRRKEKARKRSPWSPKMSGPDQVADGEKSKRRRLSGEAAHGELGQIKTRLSPSLMPERCSTPPEICAWASNADFVDEYLDLKAAVCKKKGFDAGIGKVARKYACINMAITQGWYFVSNEYDDHAPEGATGRKIKLPQLPRGCKGLKKSWDADVPRKKNFYTPMGMSRDMALRPRKGRWFYPRPSKLRNEYKPE
ncbi:hypothetical protein HDK64DRAFT_267558 [Phyllosticta capitalensis]